MIRSLGPALLCSLALATGCVITPGGGGPGPGPGPGPTCTAGIPEGNFLSFPVARDLSPSFPSGEYGYALTVGGNFAGADDWKLTLLDTTGFIDREFSGFISAGNGFDGFAPFGGANAGFDPNDVRTLVFGGFGSASPAGVDFGALSYPITLEAAVDGDYAQGRIYYVDGVTLNLCFVDGGYAAFYPDPL